MRAIVVGLAFLCLSGTALADEHTGSVQVRILGLEQVPDDWRTLNLAVRAAIGTRFLYQTPGIRGARRSWNRGLRVYTAYSRPVVLRVVETDRVASRNAVKRKSSAPVRRTSREDLSRSDETLATGMDDLVMDYGPSGAPGDAQRRDPDGEPEAFRYPVGEDRYRVLCKTKIKWPPADGEHRLDCGEAVLRVTTRWLGR